MPQSPDFRYDVFLSHNTGDKPRVRRLAERLKKAGLRVWFDGWAIRPGDDIYLAIERGLEAARVQVLCLSPTALGSDWVALERSTVLFRDPTNAGRRFIPVVLANCELPDTLRRYKYVDFQEEAEAAFEELLTALRVKSSTWRRCGRSGMRSFRQCGQRHGMHRPKVSGFLRHLDRPVLFVRRLDPDPERYTERRTTCPVPRRTPERR